MTQCLTRNGSLTRKGQLWITGPHSVAQTAPTHLARPAQAQKDPVVRGQPADFPNEAGWLSWADRRPRALCHAKTAG